MRLNKKAKFILEKFEEAIVLCRKIRKENITKKDAVMKEVNKLQDEVNLFLDPKKGKIVDRKKHPKKLTLKKGMNKRVIAGKINGQKGGLKTAMTMTPEQRHQRAVKAGSSTLRRYGKAYFKHIRSLREHKRKRK